MPTRFTEELKRIYKTKVAPVETVTKYEAFDSPVWTDADFDAKPQLLVIGQNTSGKSQVSCYMFSVPVLFSFSFCGIF